MDLSGLQYPPPTDHEAFERLTRRVFAERLSMPQLNGKTGQAQHGVDIVASGPDGFVAIQCKLKDQIALESELRLSEFRKEARAARDQFRPGLRWFILATTAPNDVKLQECARELTEEFRSDGIEVQFYGWDEMRIAIGESLELREDYLGESGISNLSTKVDRHHDVHTALLQEVLNRLPSAEKSASPHLKRALERTKVKFENGQVRAALEDLKALHEDEWAEASTENRFVILTQLGSAYWALGEREVAAPLFVEASSLLPDHKTGLANLAASLAVTDDPAGAIRAAKRLLELHPGTDNGLLALIQAQEQLDPMPHPLDPVPVALQRTEEAYLGAVQVFRNRNDDRWLTLAAEGVAAHPESDLLRRMSADAVLYRLAIENGVHGGAHSSTAPSWDEVTTACTELEREWNTHISQEPTNPDQALGQNLAQLLRALDRIDDALAVLARLGVDNERGAGLTTFRGMLLAAAGRGDEAIAALERRLDVPANRILSCHISADPTRVRQLLAEGDWTGASAEERMWRSILDVEAHARLDPAFDPIPQLTVAAAEHPDRLMPLVSICRAAKDEEVIEESVATIIRIAATSTPFSDILHAATWFRETDRLKEIVALLGGRVSTTIDSPGLHLLIFALLNLNERAVLKTLLERVPEPLASTAKFSEYRAYSAFNAGDMADARKQIEAFLTCEPHNLRARLLWVQVLMRQQDEDPITTWLLGPVEALEGTTEDRAQIGHLLASRGEFERAQRYTYRLARLNPDNKFAQERFLAVVLLNPVAPATPVIAPGTVFTLIDDKGTERQYRLDADADLPFDAMDLRPGSPLSVLGMGRGEGDEIRLPSQLASAPDKVFKVGKIVHAHAFYFNHMADLMPTRFDGPVMLHKFTVDPETGSGLDVVFDTVIASGNSAAQAIEQYQTSAVSIRLLALAMQRDVIECYDVITQIPAGLFIACNGQDPGAPAIIQDNARNGCLVDTLTAELIRRHGLLDIVTAILGKPAISQSTMDDFIQRCEHDRQLGSLRSGGKLGSANGRPILLQEHPMQRDMDAADRQAALAWIRANTQIVPATGTSGLAGKLKDHLPEEIRGAVIDDILAAAQATLPILSDDLGYRRMSQSFAGVHAVGLAAVLSAALDADMISHMEYVQKLSKLAEAHHHALPISARDIVQALDIDGKEPGRSTRALIAQLGGPGANLRIHLTVAAAALDSLWVTDEHRRHRLQLIFLVADRLLETSPSARSSFGEAVLRDPDSAVVLLKHYVTALVSRPGPASQTP